MINKINIFTYDDIEVINQGSICKVYWYRIAGSKKEYARARMEIKRMHLNGGGVCQGRAIFTLTALDSGAVTNGRGELTVSIHSGINFFRSESKGYLYATVHEIFNYKRICNYEVQVTNEKLLYGSHIQGNGLP